MKAFLERMSKIKRPSFNIIAGTLAVVIILQSMPLLYFLLQRPAIGLPDPPSGASINVRDMGALGNGRTDDSKAIALAFNEAQTKGLDLYFPAGTYNFNGLNLTAKKNLRIYGAGVSTVLNNPGQISCQKDVAVENLAVYKSTGVFISMKPDAYSSLLVDRVKVYNDRLMAAEDCRPFYACNNALNTGKGINNVTFTNNTITKCMTGLMLQCEVKSGLIDNNVITKIGTTSVSKQTYGITVGAVDISNKWVCANNVVISNNVIEDIYAPAKPINNVYAILVTGYNIQILNNTVKNQIAFTGINAKASDLHSGIYAKASDLLIKGNTIINAGAHSSICVKNNPLRRPDDGRTDNDNIVVEDNTISSSIDAFGGIRFEATNFTVRNNSIEVFATTDAFLGSTGITAKDLPVQWAVIEGNTIYTETKNAIIIEKMPGNVTIKNNKIKHNMVSANLSEAGVLALRNASATTVVECTGNTFDIARGRYLLYGTKFPEGSTLNFKNNTVNAKAFNGWLIYMDNMSCNMVNNTITLNDNPEFYAAETTKFGLLSGGATAKPYQIDHNKIYCNDGNVLYLFQLPTSFTMSGNQFTFSPKSKLAAILTYNPMSRAGAGMTSTITNNTVNTIRDVSQRGDITNIDYFMRFYTTGAYPFPRLNISNNSATLNMRLIQRSSASREIVSDGLINIADNKVHSMLYSGNAAVIDPKLNESSLKLMGNTSY